ncbi:hypothetical protein [Streptomyces sp. NPDC127197]|uniref:hypothetical protein n=1 Tax=Streptomyces sp. NPDC127197 TaxID=3345388 RepID=UPI003638446D
MFKRVATIAGTCAAVALASTVAAAPASAAVIVSVCTDAYAGYVDCAGKGWFDENGDHFYLRDNKADSAGVVMRVYVDGTYYDEFRNSDGAGDTNHWNRDIAEGKEITLFVCVSDNGEDQYDTCDSATGSPT